MRGSKHKPLPWLLQALNYSQVGGRAAAVLHEVQIVGELLSVRQVFSDFRKCAADVLLSGDESALTGSACTCS